MEALRLGILQRCQKYFTPKEDPDSDHSADEEDSGMSFAAVFKLDKSYKKVSTVDNDSTCSISGLGAYSDNHHSSSSGGRAQDDEWASWSNNTQSSHSQKQRQSSDDWSGWGDDEHLETSKKISSKSSSSSFSAASKKKNSSKKDENLLIDFGGEDKKEGDWANDWEEDAWESLNK